MGRTGVTPIATFDGVEELEPEAPARPERPNGEQNGSAARHAGSPGQGDADDLGEDYEEFVVELPERIEKKTPRIIAVALWLLLCAVLVFYGAVTAAGAQGGKGLEQGECVGPVTVELVTAPADLVQLGVPPEVAPGVVVAAVLVLFSGLPHALWAKLGCQWTAEGRLYSWAPDGCSRPASAVLGGVWPLLSEGDARRPPEQVAERIQIALQSLAAQLNTQFASPVPCAAGPSGLLGGTDGGRYGLAAILEEPEEVDAGAIRTGVVCAAVGVAGACLCVIGPLRRCFSLHSGRRLRRCAKATRGLIRKLRHKTKLKDAVGAVEEDDTGPKVVGTQGVTSMAALSPMQLREQQQKQDHPLALNDRLIRDEPKKEEPASPGPTSKAGTASAPGSPASPAPSSVQHGTKVKAMHNWQSRRQSEVSYCGPRASEIGDDLPTIDGLGDCQISLHSSQSRVSRVSESGDDEPAGHIPALDLAQLQTPADGYLPPLALGTLATSADRRASSHTVTDPASPETDPGVGLSAAALARHDRTGGWAPRRGRAVSVKSFGARSRRGMSRSRSVGGAPRRSGMIMMQWSADGSAVPKRLQTPQQPLTPRTAALPAPPDYFSDDAKSVKTVRSARSCVSRRSGRSTRSVKKPVQSAPPSRLDLMATEAGTGTKLLAARSSKWDLSHRGAQSEAGSDKSAHAGMRRANSLHNLRWESGYWREAEQPRRRSVSGGPKMQPKQDGLLEKCYDLSRRGAVEHLSKLDEAVRSTTAPRALAREPTA